MVGSYSLNASHWTAPAVTSVIAAFMFLSGHNGLGLLFVILTLGLAVLMR